MLPGIGAGEYIIIAVAALVVIGPKNLPVVMRKVGQFVARLRSMAAEFRASFDEMARQSELDELRKQVEELRSGRLMEPIQQDIAPTVAEIESDLRGGASGWMSDIDRPVEEPDRPASEPAPVKSARKRTPAAKPAAKTAAKAKSASKPKPAAKASPAKASAAKPAAKPRARKVAAS